MLKTIAYPGNAPPYNGQIVYAINGNTCVFSGITRGTTSTINAAEEIIAAIAEEEKLDTKHATFFDLQTQNGYSDYETGEFQFERLVFEVARGQIRNVSWEQVVCPRAVIDLFLHLIGAPPQQVSAGGMAITGDATEEHLELTD